MLEVVAVEVMEAQVQILMPVTVDNYVSSRVAEDKVLLNQEQQVEQVIYVVLE
jgi:hypothetical protein